MIKVKKLCPGDLLPPKQSKPGDAGYDLRAAIEDEADYIAPGEQMVIPTGYAWEIPLGWCGMAWPRSGTAIKARIDTRAGLIDSTYRGEVAVVLTNEGDESFLFYRGDRIAQMVVVPHMMGPVLEVDELRASVRGTSGFGDSGIK